jgi:acyl-CoA synthetase (AMP-forming)/AMP-acid ligase II
MTVKLWQDYHNHGLLQEIDRAWRGEQLLIVCPPTLKDRTFESTIAGHKEWPDQPVLGVFTSGTLSLTPRLVLYSRRNIEAALDSIHQLFDLNRIDHLFCYPQAFHTFGLTLGYVAALHRGWKLHTPRGKYSLAAHAERYRLRERNTLTLGTPTHFFDLVTYCRQNGVNPEPSYSCIMGGASVAQTLWHDAREELKIEAPSIGYGCTEASPGITHLAPGVPPTTDSEIGYPLGSITSKISKRGVNIEGESLCLAIVQDGKIEFPKKICIRDQIEVDTRGSWHFLGRLDLTLNRGGVKYSLEAIERDLASSTRVPVVTAAVKDARLGQDLAIAVVGEQDSQALRVQVEEILSSRWGLRLNPARLRFMSDLPLNECAKLDRRRLEEKFL